MAHTSDNDEIIHNYRQFMSFQGVTAQTQHPFIEFVNQKLNDLNAEKLKNYFKIGNLQYIYRLPTSGELSTWSNINPTILFRSAKANNRINLQEITDQNCKEILLKFLEGDGNKDVNSQKFRLIEAMLFTDDKNKVFFHVADNNSSQKLIDLIVLKLGPKPSIDMDDSRHYKL